MDQSICLLGEQGKAKKINFNPLGTEDVRLPDNAAFVIAHSCTSKEKAKSNGMRILTLGRCNLYFDLNGDF